jgi:GNAT superfamily N-acetyltransferase
VSFEAEAAFRPIIRSAFPEDKYPEIWQLLLLVVQPGYQKRGVGRQLMRWGLERAMEENVGFGVESLPAGEKLYKSCGLRLIREIEEMRPLLPWEERLCAMYAEADEIRIPEGAR